MALRLTEGLGRTLDALKAGRWLKPRRFSMAQACTAAPTTARPALTASRGGLDKLDLDAGHFAHNNSKLQRSAFDARFLRPGIGCVRVAIHFGRALQTALVLAGSWSSAMVRRRSVVGQRTRESLKRGERFATWPVCGLTCYRRQRYKADMTESYVIRLECGLGRTQKSHQSRADAWATPYGKLRGPCKTWDWRHGCSGRGPTTECSCEA